MERKWKVHLKIVNWLLVSGHVNLNIRHRWFEAVVAVWYPRNSHLYRRPNLSHTTLKETKQIVEQKERETHTHTHKHRQRNKLFILINRKLIRYMNSMYFAIERKWERFALLASVYASAFLCLTFLLTLVSVFRFVLTLAFRLRCSHCLILCSISHKQTTQYFVHKKKAKKSQQWAYFSLPSPFHNEL